MHRSPYNKGIGSTMPETAHRKDNHRVEYPSGFAATVATEREIDIVTKPSSKRDMPPAPEIRYCLGEIGSAEVGL